MLEGLGAEVILVPQVDGAPGQVTGADVQRRRTWPRRAPTRGFYVDQFNAVECIAAHEAGTGREILEQLGRPADGWVAAWARAAPSWAWRGP